MKRIYYPLDPEDIIWAGTEGEPMPFTVQSIEVIEGELGCEDDVIAYLAPVRLVPQIPAR